MENYIMYPLTVQLDYTELKYSLRSLEKYISEPFEVIIVGEIIPDWVTNVTHLKLKDIPGRKQLSIRRKILAALEYSEEIFFLNDDHFLLKPTDPKNYPFYFSGNLKKVGETGARHLEVQLDKMGKNLKHFDCHAPILYNREMFKEASQHFNADCIIKSLYCNYWNMDGVEVDDTKIKINKKLRTEEIENIINGQPVLSTGTIGLKYTLPLLEKLFPNKSKYEY